MVAVSWSTSSSARHTVPRHEPCRVSHTRPARWPLDGSRSPWWLPRPGCGPGPGRGRPRAACSQSHLRPQPVGGATSLVPRLVTPRTVRAGRGCTAVAGVAMLAAEEHHDVRTATGGALAELGGTLTEGRAGYRVHRVLTSGQVGDQGPGSVLTHRPGPPCVWRRLVTAQTDVCSVATVSHNGIGTRHCPTLGR